MSNCLRCIINYSACYEITDKGPSRSKLRGGECLFLNNVPESVSLKISISAVFKKMTTLNTVSLQILGCFNQTIATDVVILVLVSPTEKNDELNWIGMV